MATPHRLEQRARRLAAVVLLGAVVAGGCGIALKSRDEDAHGWLTARLVRPEGGAGEVRGPDEAALRAREVLDELERTLSPSSPRLLWPTLLAMGCIGAWWLGARRRWPPRTPDLVVRSVLLLDLFVFGATFNPRVSSEVVDRWPDSVIPLLGQAGPFRATVLDRRVSSELDWALASSNLGLLWDMEDVIVPSPLRTLRNETWLERAGLDLGLVDADEQVRAFEVNRVLADISGVRFLFTTRLLSLPDLSLILEHPTPHGTVRVYENLRALPRAFVVGCTEAPNGAALDAVAALDDPRGKAIVEGEGLLTCRPGAAGTVAVLRTMEAALELDVEVDATGGWLVVTESFYPGMQFNVDGKKRIPVRTNDLFMGIPLSPGNHKVMVAYVPVHLYAAMAVSALVGTLAISWFIVATLRRRTPARESS